MGRRTLLLVAALLLAAIGTGVLFLFLRATATSTSGGGGTGNTVSVVVPEVTVVAGTKIDGTVRFRTISVPRATAQTAGMVIDAKSLQGLLAIQTLPAYVPVTAQQFGDAVKDPTDLAIAPGNMALTVEMSDPNRVGTFLRKGSQVAIFVVDPQPASADGGHSARMVLSPVTVLTTGSSGTILPRSTSTAASGSGSNGGRGSQALVTLQVNQQQAGRILVAQASGELYFTLLGPGATATPKDYGPSDIAVRNLP